MCSNYRPSFVYFFLQEILLCLKLNKPKGFQKTITSVFAGIKSLHQCLKATVSPDQNIWNSIVLVVATNSFHDDFNPHVSRLLGQRREKIIHKIQSVLAFTEKRILSKKTIRLPANLAHMSKNNRYRHKQIVIYEYGCYNYHKIKQFRQDCKLLDFWLLKRKV